MALRGDERRAKRQAGAGTALLNLRLAFDVKLRVARTLVHTQRRGLFLAAAPFRENGHHSAEEAAQGDADEKALECCFPHLKRLSEKGEKKGGKRTAGNLMIGDDRRGAEYGQTGHPQGVGQCVPWNRLYFWFATL